MSSCRSLLRVVLFASLALLFAACGNKGALVKPGTPEEAKLMPVTPIEVVPAPAYDADGH